MSESTLSEPMSTGPRRWTWQRIREDFPILRETSHGKPIVYLDNAASTQKPRQVIDAIATHYERDNANVHRGIHELSNRATDAYDGARAKVAALFGIADPAELVWTRGTTEALNLIAYTWGMANLRAGDEILLSVLEHHSNLVPWQLAGASARARGCAFWRSTTRAGWTCRGWTTCSRSGRSWSPSPTCATRWAR